MFAGEGAHGDASDRLLIHQCAPVQFLPLFLVTRRRDYGFLNIHGRVTLGVNGRSGGLHSPSLRKLGTERHINRRRALVVEDQRNHNRLAGTDCNFWNGQQLRDGFDFVGLPKVRVKLTSIPESQAWRILGAGAKSGYWNKCNWIRGQVREDVVCRRR